MIMLWITALMIGVPFVYLVGAFNDAYKMQRFLYAPKDDLPKWREQVGIQSVVGFSIWAIILLLGILAYVRS